MKKKKLTLEIAMGGLFAALFFVSSNLLPPINVIPGVPITLQIMVVTMMAGFLGFKMSGMVLATIYLMTLFGIPMMSGFSGGPAAFLKPTGGFIVGWIFIILAVGLYHDLASQRVRGIKTYGGALNAAGFILSGTLGVVLCYLCGAAWLVIFNKTGFASLAATFTATFTAFVLVDIAKVVTAFVLVEALDRTFRALYFTRERVPH